MQNFKISQLLSYKAITVVLKYNLKYKGTMKAVLTSYFLQYMDEGRL